MTLGWQCEHRQAQHDVERHDLDEHRPDRQAGRAFDRLDHDAGHVGDGLDAGNRQDDAR